MEARQSTGLTERGEKELSLRFARAQAVTREEKGQEEEAEEAGGGGCVQLACEDDVLADAFISLVRTTAKQSSMKASCSCRMEGGRASCGRRRRFLDSREVEEASWLLVNSGGKNLEAAERGRH